MIWFRSALRSGSDRSGARPFGAVIPSDQMGDRMDINLIMGFSIGLIIALCVWVFWDRMFGGVDSIRGVSDGKCGWP